ncbi:phosphate acyltransferase [Neobacillus sp.]|uniref:phosphate acyltransferase n=1 Tax=Neobacillus sp. TaxID=2675273 RepID=UPI0028A06E9E|nr:phosphate acyltransferase [Neobacillus sp.]
MRFKNFSEVIQKAQTEHPLPISIAQAHDVEVLKAVQEAVELGLIEPLFVGDREKTIELAEKLSFDLHPFKLYHASGEDEACFLATELASTGRAKAIMKGLANSTPFLKGVLHKELKLKSNRLISHLSAFEIPGFDRIVYMTDGGLNIQPSIEQKKEIIVNASLFLHTIGLMEPRVALLAANERMNPKMPVTGEAQEITRFFEREYPKSLLIEGPLPLDLAISETSLLHKGLVSKLDGKADLLVVPTIEAGNIFGKAITYFAGGTMAGIVLGAKVPLILNSRSDSSKAKLASIALAVVSSYKCETSTV